METAETCPDSAVTSGASFSSQNCNQTTEMCLDGRRQSSVSVTHRQQFTFLPQPPSVFGHQQFSQSNDPQRSDCRSCKQFPCTTTGHQQLFDSLDCQLDSQPCRQHSPRSSSDQQSSQSRHQQSSHPFTRQQPSQSRCQLSPRVSSDGELSRSHPDPPDVSAWHRPHTGVKHSRSVVCSNTCVGDAHLDLLHDLPGVLRTIFQ